MATTSERIERTSEDRWKSRYLVAVEAQERVERDAGTRVGELGSLLVRLSRALPPAEAHGLSKRLGTLAGALKRRPLDPELSLDMRELQDRVVDVMETCERERTSLHGALADATRSLESLCTTRAFKRRLKSFRSSLSRREPSLPSELVAALSELQDVVLEELDPRAGDETGRDLVVPVRNEPSGPVDRSVASETVTTAENRPTAAGVAAAGSTATPGPAAPIDWVGVRQVLAGLVERIDVAQGLRSQVQQVTRSLEDDLGEESLLRILGSIRDLMDVALAGMTLEFQGFLDSVDRRLDTLLGTLGRAREEGRKAAALEKNLSNSFQSSIAAMRTDAAAATRLDELKSSIDSHLVTLVHSVESFDQDRGEHGASRDAGLAAMEHRLRELESESREARGQLEVQRELARTDSLTSLPNRKAMDERLASELEAAHASGAPLAVAIADIDHFKRVNDRFGHSAGDRALVLFAGILAQRIRQSDFCARFGGEEFLLLFPDTAPEVASSVLEQIREFVAGCGFSYKGEPVPLTASFGVTGLAPSDDTGSVLERADRALYAAKEGGRNRVVVEP